MEVEQIKKIGPIDFGDIDRQSVRAFVAEYTSKLDIAAYCGDNVHQLALDQEDNVARLTADWTDENKALFSKLYTEELTAYINSKNDKANLLNAQVAQQNITAAQNASNFATWISIILFFVVLISLIRLLK